MGTQTIDLQTLLVRVFDHLPAGGATLPIEVCLGHRHEGPLDLPSEVGRTVLPGLLRRAMVGQPSGAHLLLRTADVVDRVRITGTWSGGGRRGPNPRAPSASPEVEAWFEPDGGGAFGLSFRRVLARSSSDMAPLVDVESSGRRSSTPSQLTREHPCVSPDSPVSN